MKATPYILVSCVALSLRLSSSAQHQDTPRSPWVKEDAPVLVLEHVRLIDGSGGPPQEDVRIDIAAGKIAAVSSAKSSPAYPPNARVLDLAGKTVIPGLVGMHEHLFYPLEARPEHGIPFYGQMIDSAPRLYLAGGVTTARTAGSLDPYTDLELKKLIDAGAAPGPSLDVTGPYLEGKGTFAMQMHQLADADDAARTVDYWAAEGVTSFKAYNYITPEELKAAIDHAHAHGIKITGHLCSVGFRAAIAMGIDNLEHGLIVDTDFYPKKSPNECPVFLTSLDNLQKNVDVEGADVQALIRDLVAHHVAVTSTLAVVETFSPNRPPMARETAALDTLDSRSAKEYLTTRASLATSPGFEKLLHMEMRFERDFVAAGGLLMAGCDPTGYGGVLPGFGDQRNIELLVEAGFSPVEAIRIATLNGATYLGRETSIGSIAPGKEADLVVLGGNPAEKIENIEKVETVFKHGIGYDPARLIQSVTGVMGLR